MSEFGDEVLVDSNSFLLSIKSDFKSINQISNEHLNHLIYLNDFLQSCISEINLIKCKEAAGFIIST